MKENIKISLSLFFDIIVVSVMCLILSVSLSFLSMAVFKGGYEAYVSDEKGNSIETYKYNGEGEDTLLAEYESKGYKVQKVNVTSKTGEVVDFIVYTVFALIILMTFVYYKLYPVGNKDFNAVKCGHKPEDKLRGLKIGSIASSLHILFYISMVVLKFAKPDFSVGYYKIVNIIYFKILNVAMGSTTLADVPPWGFIVMLLPLCVVPLIAHISYTLGYKDIKISDKLKYKKGEIK